VPADPGFVDHDGGYVEHDLDSMAFHPESAPTVVTGGVPTPPPDGVLGREIGGKYKVQRFLAKGGMGRVYAGHELETERSVAIKTLAVDSDDALFRRRFFNEAAMSASLSHPNVVDVLDYGVDDDGTCYIVMELLEGETLAALVKREKRLDVAHALRIVRQVCAALTAAHAEGFIHRDLKPSNLFITPIGDEGDYVVKVLDFGLAKRLSADNSLTQTGSFLGSPTYMSPEQITGTELTVASDLYNLGVLLYRMVAGRPPFVGDVASAVLVDHATKAPPSFADTAPDLPARPQVEWVVMRCLAKSPADRFATADELDRAIHACLRLEEGESSYLGFDMVEGKVEIHSDRAEARARAKSASGPQALTWAIAVFGVGIGAMLAAMGLVGLVAWLLSNGL